MKTIETADSIEELVDAIRRAAYQCDDAAGELEATWQDKSAGRPWHIAAVELEKAADRILASLTPKRTPTLRNPPTRRRKPAKKRTRSK